MERKYNTFWSFYPYYLTEHSNPVCRITHYIGTTGLLVVIAAAAYFGEAKLLFLLPVVGYGFACWDTLRLRKTNRRPFSIPYIA